MSLFWAVSNSGPFKIQRDVPYDPPKSTDSIFCRQSRDLDQCKNQYFDTTNCNQCKLQFDLYQNQTLLVSISHFYTRHHNNFSPRTKLSNAICVWETCWTTTLFKNIVGVTIVIYFTWMHSLKSLFCVTTFSGSISFTLVACRLLGVTVLMASSIVTLIFNANVSENIKARGKH